MDKEVLTSEVYLKAPILASYFSVITNVIALIATFNKDSVWIIFAFTTILTIAFTFMLILWVKKHSISKEDESCSVVECSDKILIDNNAKRIVWERKVILKTLTDCDSYSFAPPGFSGTHKFLSAKFDSENSRNLHLSESCIGSITYFKVDFNERVSKGKLLPLLILCWEYTTTKKAKQLGFSIIMHPTQHKGNLGIRSLVRLNDKADWYILYLDNRKSIQSGTIEVQEKIIDGSTSYCIDYDYSHFINKHITYNFSLSLFRD